MKEKILHYIWQYKLYKPLRLKTSDNQIIEVIDPGKLNTDAGPDFFNAKIKIEDTLWAGNIEIHINASDWKKHQHDKNPAYDSVILHVVTKIDAIVYRTNGEKIPQAALIYPIEMEQKYSDMLRNSKWIACADKLKTIDSVLIHSCLSAMLTDRLQHKSNNILLILEKTKNNWEEAFYLSLARSFGFGTNSDAFELLAKSLPLQYLGKHKNNLFQLEALLFGQSGLLKLKKKNSDEYQRLLEKEYNFLSAKFKLTPIESGYWKMMRLRPSNFPYIRIAQFAALIHRSTKLFSKIIDKPSLKELQKLFNCEPNEYWATHYQFGEDSPLKLKKIGKTTINSLLINTVIPFLFCYGRNRQNDTLQNAAINLLEELPAEKNSIIKNWMLLGIKATSAYDSQALIQLKKCYCEEKKCLRCKIGHKVLSSNQ